MTLDTPYIFIIGFNKSGTTSIHNLFSNNGIPSLHWDNGNLARKCLLNTIQGKRVLDGYDAQYNVFSDMFFRNENFWFEGNTLFREMHKDYPNSFFVYNKREVNDWIKSRISHPKKINGLTLVELQKKILRTDDLNVVINHWKKTRSRFEEDIREYFGGSEKFIELDISDIEFVKKISQITSLNLAPEYWKKSNVTISR